MRIAKALSAAIGVVGVLLATNASSQPPGKVLATGLAFRQAGPVQITAAEHTLSRLYSKVSVRNVGTVAVAEITFGLVVPDQPQSLRLLQPLRVRIEPGRSVTLAVPDAGSPDDFLRSGVGRVELGVVSARTADGAVWSDPDVRASGRFRRLGTPPQPPWPSEAARGDSATRPKVMPDFVDDQVGAPAQIVGASHGAHLYESVTLRHVGQTAIAAVTFAALIDGQPMRRYGPIDVPVAPGQQAAVPLGGLISVAEATAFATAAAPLRVTLGVSGVRFIDGTSWTSGVESTGRFPRALAR